MASAVERAKQVTMTELNAVIGVNIYNRLSFVISRFICHYATYLKDLRNSLIDLLTLLSSHLFISLTK